MSITREIITIQAGNCSNFIGTHWWNMQESSFVYDQISADVCDLNHDVVFREGMNRQGDVTYTPRLVLIDLDDHRKSIRRECPLYRNPADDRTLPHWDSPLEVIKEEPIKRNTFMEEFEKASVSNPSAADCGKIEHPFQSNPDFNSSHTLWSDYLRTNLHPESFCLFRSTSSVSKSPLDAYSYGRELYSNYLGEAIEESIRKMAEHCDYLQGFHLLFDAHNCFAGISNSTLQFLNDEYGKQGSLCFPVYQDNVDLPIQDTKKQMHRLYSSMVSLSSLSTHSSLFSPLCISDDTVKLTRPFKKFPFIHCDENVLYNTSSIFAASIDTLTSPYRLKKIMFDLSDLTTSMSTSGRKLVSASCSLPFPLRPDDHLSEMTEKDVQDFFMTSLTPFYTPEAGKTAFQSAVLRGVPEDRFYRNKNSSHMLTPEEVFGQFLNKYSPSSVSATNIIKEKCCVSHPFPNIFKIADPGTGRLNSCATFNEKGLHKIPICASFSSSDSAKHFIEDLLSQAKHWYFKDYIKSSEESYDKDVFQEVIENLLNLQECY